MEKQQVGVIGLAAMGKNLAQNIADHGYSVCVYNRSPEKTHELLSVSQGMDIKASYSVEEFANSLITPRKIIIMVKAGAAVDSTIEKLIPYLEKGDIIIDGGNSFYKDTKKRYDELWEKGLNFIGAGISGGEEGARLGPAIMPGGSKAGYKEVEKLLTDISAKVGGEPCCTYIGEDGAGHFVKMVHNGIEYADMQLISEAYFILKTILGQSVPQMHKTFSEWNEGELSSYLIEITSDIMTKVDPDTGGYLVDTILDVAEQKGTGKWTSQAALDMGVAIPTITESVFMRYLSSYKQERVDASRMLKGPSGSVVRLNSFAESVRRALYASKICSYAQGFSLMSAASKEYGWELNLGEIAKIFRGGCIIRAQFLGRITEAYKKSPELANLLLDDYFKKVIEEYQDDWRKVIIASTQAGIPVPGFSSALAYYDSYRTEKLPMNLLQAQRDYFGAHTYKRVDKEGVFHTKWKA